MTIAKHYINGRWVEAIRGKGVVKDNINPATSEVVAQYCDGGEAEAAAAVSAAYDAFNHTAWPGSAKMRSEVLYAFAMELERRKDEIADWLVTLNGKLRREALGEIHAGISELRYYAGLARNLFGRIIEIESGCYSSLDREPAGVAAIILPWNAPVTLMVRSLAPALAAGCTVVIKPAHQTALVSNMVLECLVSDERLPPGTVNSVIESGADVAQHLCSSPGVDVVSFTGSSRVGKLIAQASAGTLKRLSLELGGKAPAVVFDDCDMEEAVAGVVAGSMVMAGQQCTGIERVVVSSDIYDEFSRRLTQALKNLKVGFGTDPESQMGSLINLASRDRVAALVDEASQVGDVLQKGLIPDGALAKGAFLEPSLIALQDLSSPLIQEEIFGPVLVIERFTGEADAIERSNATHYSLAASIWTSDGLKARRVASRLKFGTVWLNAHNRLFAEVETGGYGDSGYGKLHGVEGLNDFMQTKHFYFETR
ncbi:MAG TPA: aldehyde dehydrogenase [Pusillimonas sp.]|nr:aldehyde dehydrogenase [Pusillimonas sp.]